MKKINLVTDSSAQLTSAEIASNHITVVPLSIDVDGKTYVDGVDVTRNGFIELMKESKDLPTTSQPSVGKFQEVFDNLTKDGEAVLCITMTEGLSGTVNAARQAAELLADREIEVVDSKFIDRGLSFQLLEAAKDIAAGKTMPEILEHLQSVEKNTFLKMAVVNLDNLIKGGRLGKMTGRIATLLNIRVTLTLTDGQLELESKGRGKKFVTAYKEEIKDLIKRAKNVKGIGISYVAVKDEMETFGRELQALAPQAQVLVQETSPIVATHAGLGAFAVLYYVGD